LFDCSGRSRASSDAPMARRPGITKNQGKRGNGGRLAMAR
jgi:hypothetical protein